MKSHGTRPLVAFLANQEILDWLMRDREFHEILRQNDIFDFGFRESVENVLIEDENLFVIIFINKDASEEWLSFAAENKKNERVRRIYDSSKQLAGPNYSLLKALFINELDLLKKKFPQLNQPL